MSFIRGRSFDPRNAIAGAAVAYLDPDSRDVSATCWSSSERINAASTTSFAHELAGGNLPSNAAALFSHLRAALEARPVTSEMLTLADEIESASRLLFHRSETRPSTRVFVRPTVQQVVVVIPFRSGPDTPLRTANLRAVVGALAGQDLARSQYSIVVVEEAAESAVPADVIRQIDTLISIPYAGPFNKALALNRGVAAAPGDAIVCLLDGDSAPDSGFLARNASRVALRPDAAHLPYSDMFCLLPEDSAAVRRGEQPGDAPRDGYVITHPPGGCVFVTAELYRACGGFDERFVGWGGEDRDFIDRIEERASVRRHPELLVHLHHERPPMRASRHEIMSSAAAGPERRER